MAMCPNMPNKMPCYNRKPYAESYVAKQGVSEDGAFILERIRNRNTKSCKFDFKKENQGCEGCHWRDNLDPRDLFVVAPGWDHIFDGSRSPRGVRFVFDRNSNAIIYMDLATATGWQKASADEIADVQDSLLNGNPDALEKLGDFGLEESLTLPEWVRLK